MNQNVSITELNEVLLYTLFTGLSMGVTVFCPQSLVCENLFNSINTWKESPELPKAKYSSVQMHYLLLIRVTTFLYSTIHTKTTQHEAWHKDTTHISFQNYAYLNWQSSPNEHDDDMANGTVQLVLSTWWNTIYRVSHTSAATLQSWQLLTIKTLAQNWCNKKCYSAPQTHARILFRHQEYSTERHYKDSGFVNNLYLWKQFTSHKQHFTPTFSSNSYFRRRDSCQ